MKRKSKFNSRSFFFYLTTENKVQRKNVKQSFQVINDPLCEPKKLYDSHESINILANFTYFSNNVSTLMVMHIKLQIYS